MHLSQNLHIHYGHLSRNLHIHYVQISPAFFNWSVAWSRNIGIYLAIQSCHQSGKAARKKGGGRKVNVVVEGPVGEFSNSEKIGKGKY